MLQIMSEVKERKRTMKQAHIRNIFHIVCTLCDRGSFQNKHIKCLTAGCFNSWSSFNLNAVHCDTLCWFTFNAVLGSTTATKIKNSVPINRSTVIHWTIHFECWFSTILLVARNKWTINTQQWDGFGMKSLFSFRARFRGSLFWVGPFNYLTFSCIIRIQMWGWSRHWIIIFANRNSYSFRFCSVEIRCFSKRIKHMPHQKVQSKRTWTCHIWMWRPLFHSNATLISAY